MTKEQIRRTMKEQRNNLSKEERFQQSSELNKRLFHSVRYRDCESIFTYVSFGTEADTHAIILQALEDNKKVYVPRVNKEDMEFYQIHSIQGLVPSKFGIPEPKEEEAKKYKLGYGTDHRRVMLLPGLAFDLQGNRIGYGAGYYDKYLTRFPKGHFYKIALAYDFQVMNQIVSEDYDQRADLILTPAKSIDCSRKGGKLMNYLEQLGSNAKKAATALSLLGQEAKNNALKSCAKALIESKEEILAANENDIRLAAEHGMRSVMLDRLKLTPERIAAMAEGLIEISSLPDPIGEVLSMTTRPNGLIIGQKVVPLGVIGMIYESRPNVTADTFGLCFKTGNAVILRGGSDALRSNQAIVKALRSGLRNAGCDEYALQLIEDTSREIAREFMRLNRYIDVLIPRGGAGLIQTVMENSTVPVIETGTGNCHIYVDASADFSMALDIIDNAKTQRLSVCNACESLVLHSKIFKEFLPLIYDRLHAKDIEIRGDERARALHEDLVPATEEDYGTEYLDRIISLKIVDSIEEAIAHINYYSTKHSESIITKDYDNAMKFLNEIDSAAVYVNASTRFTDGYEFGFGAEIGISTQKLHARGPMGLKALTTTKYIIFGNGQIRK